MAFAVEICFDKAGELKLMALRRAIRAAGADNVLDDLGSRPHIALACYERPDPSRLIGAMKEFNAGRLTLLFSSLGTFPGKGNVIFAAPKVTPELLSIHRKFHRLFAGFSDAATKLYLPSRWVPHCTLAMEQTNRDYRKSFLALKEKFVPFTARIGSLELVEYRPVRVLFSKSPRR